MTWLIRIFVVVIASHHDCLHLTIHWPKCYELCCRFFFSHRSPPRGDPIFLVRKLFLPWLPVLWISWIASSPLAPLHFILLTHVQIHPATSSSLQNHGNINRHMGRSPDVLGCPSFLRGSRCYPYSVRLLRSPRYSRFRPSHQSILQARGTAITSRFVVLL